jgi:GDP-mannose pyrophosphatase NudK
MGGFAQRKDNISHSIKEHMNERVKNLHAQTLSDNWYTLKKITYDYFSNGQWKTMNREAYDRGNGAVILLYNRISGTVILTRQFRLPTFINGNETGMLIEACAGLLDKDNAEDCIRRETEEETGYKISEVKKVFEAYMSPGSVTEMLYFFIAEYSKEMKVNEGGGLAHEQEDIEVLEIKLEEAMKMIGTGEIKDGKTIMLLQYMLLNKIMG